MPYLDVCPATGQPQFRAPRMLAITLLGFSLLLALRAGADELPPDFLPAAASTGTNSQPWCFAFVADTHIFYPAQDHDDVVRAIAADMTLQHVSLALFGGDLIRGHAEASTGLTRQYQRWLETMSPLFNARIPVYAVPGNHEKWGQSEADETLAWNQNIASHMPAEGRTDNPLHPGMEYSFAFNNALFIGLDEFRFTGGNDFPRMFRSFDTDWVAERLARRDKKATPFVFVFGHCPAFLADGQWPAPYDAKRDEFWHLLMKEGVTLYLAGHNHVYARTAVHFTNEPSVPQQLIVGTGGGATSADWQGKLADGRLTETVSWNAQCFGYLLATVSGKGVHLEWRGYNRDAKVFTVADRADLH